MERDFLIASFSLRRLEGKKETNGMIGSMEFRKHTEGGNCKV